eukprot:scaffold404208_cov14-Prasinocladus_malaysianus.AAC.1
MQRDRPRGLIMERDQQSSAGTRNRTMTPWTFTRTSICRHRTYYEYYDMLPPDNVNTNTITHGLT